MCLDPCPRLLRLRFQLLFFFFLAVKFDFSTHHCSHVLDFLRQSALFIGPTSTLLKKKIKNGSHNTIYTFKNCFATVFSVFSKISCIQMDFLSVSLRIAYLTFYWNFAKVYLYLKKVGKKNEVLKSAHLYISKRWSMVFIFTTLLLSQLIAMSLAT